ncbi:hypothetical protein GQ42DRAFT_91468 [Ramicandelaber brevisporus]|nr:hypothetical protein GQ42DRAFT_91468 [Ramicandelaber brevisporus]
MKLTSKRLSKDGSGTLTLKADEPEDMWHLFNIISAGDFLTASSFRKVQTESLSGATTSSQRVKVRITIRVEEVDFDAPASVLRARGKNIAENKFVKMGQYHTIEVMLHRPVVVGKVYWDSVSLDRISSACDVKRNAKVAALVMDEGLANMCLITDYTTVLRQRIEVNIPKKRSGSTTEYDKGMGKFFEQARQALLKHVDFDVVKAVILASPGFVKDQFYQYLLDSAMKQVSASSGGGGAAGKGSGGPAGGRTGSKASAKGANIEQSSSNSGSGSGGSNNNDPKVILVNKDKFILVHSSSGHKGALNEVMADEAVVKRVADTKAAKEIKAIQRFHEMLGTDEDRAYYGFSHVRKANEEAPGCVQTLMIVDSLFRSNHIGTRQKYVQLAEDVKNQGGEVLIFSSLHGSGEQLNQMSGIAAILHFPVQGIGDDDSDDEDGGDSDEGEGAARAAIDDDTAGATQFAMLGLDHADDDDDDE